MHAMNPTVADGLAAARRGDIDAAIEIANQLGGNDSAAIQAEVGRVIKGGNVAPSQRPSA